MNQTASETTFFKMPKALFTDGKYKGLSLSSKVLYGLLSDRMALSRANNWRDGSGRLYIIYSISAICEDLGCGKNKAVRLLKELEDAGLIERLKRRKNLTDLIYVLPLASPESKAPDEPENAAEDKSVDNSNSGGLILKTPEVSKSNPNKTKINNTEGENIFDDKIDKPLTDVRIQKPRESGNVPAAQNAQSVQNVQSAVCGQIEYNVFRERFPYPRVQLRYLNEIVENITEIYCLRDEPRSRIKIGGKKYSVAFVQHRFRQLNYDSVKYVMDCMAACTSRIRNIKAYLMAALFNAPTTLDNYCLNRCNCEGV